MCVKDTLEEKKIDTAREQHTDQANHHNKVFVRT